MDSDTPGNGKALHAGLGSMVLDRSIRCAEKGREEIVVGKENRGGWDIHSNLLVGKYYIAL